MVTVIQQPGIFGSGQGLGALGEALGGAFGQRSAQSALDQALEESTINGQLDTQSLVMNAQKYGVNPTILDAYLKNLKNATPEPPSIANQFFGITPQETQTDTVQSRSEPSNRRINQEPIQTQDDQYANLDQQTQKRILEMSEREIGMLLTSPNSQDQKLGRFVKDMQDDRKQTFLEDRKFHHTISDKYFEDVDKKREQVTRMDSDLANAKYAIDNRQFGLFTEDYWAGVLGKFGEGLKTPEGKILEAATKNFLVNDIANISGRPNMFIEKQLLDALFNKMEPNLNNEMIYLSNMAKKDLINAEVELHDRLSQEYMDRDGIVPRDIKKQVFQQLKPQAQQIQDRLSYQMQEAKERDAFGKDGEEALWKMDKKVSPGTPLTESMAILYRMKYGDKAPAVAKKKGYKIMSEDEYKAL